MSRVRPGGAIALVAGLTMCLNGRAEGQILSGRYLGDGADNRAINSVGFQPDVVIIKSDDEAPNTDNSSAVLRTSSMVGDTSKPLKGTLVPAADLIQSLTASGFVVGKDRRVNRNNTWYYWVAFKAGPNLKVGTYVGNGTGQSIPGVGFSPEYVIVADMTGSGQCLHRPHISGTLSFDFQPGSTTTGITSLDADGFTVGGDSGANASGRTYHYVAFNESAGSMKVGSYLGNGVDDRSIGGVGFIPEYLIVRNMNDLRDPFQRFRPMARDYSVNFRQALATNLIQAFEPDGFELGNSTLVNAPPGNCSGGADCDYFYVAFGTSCTPQVNYRSLGTNAGTLYSTGNASVGPGSTMVTFGGGASLPTNIGIGDSLVIGAETFYIFSRDSATQVTVQTAATVAHINELYTITRAYNTLQDWDVSRQGDLVAENRREVGVAYNDGVFTAGVTIDGSTTDSCRFMMLTVAPGQRHNGTKGSGARIRLPNGGDAIRAADDWTRLHWLEIDGTTDSGSFFSAVDFLGPASGGQAANLLIYDGAFTAIDVADYMDDVVIRNCFIYNMNQSGDSGSIEFAGPHSGETLAVYNTTIFNSGKDGIGTSGAGPRSIVAKNVLVVDSALSDFGGTASYTGSDYNLSSDDTAPGASSLTFRPAVNQFLSIMPGLEDLHLKTGADALDAATNLSAFFGDDIDGAIRTAPWDVGADDAVATTAAELAALEARGGDEAVEISWETAAEIENLGFYLHRATSVQGPFERITGALIPGLGSSPLGARYRYLDSGLSNGQTYFYILEDMETSGERTKHGPISATPQPGASLPESPSTGGTGSTSGIVYGKPEESSFRVIASDRSGATLELLTGGFYAEPQSDGTVRLSVPGLVEEQGAIPVKRAWLDAVVGRKVRITSVRATEVAEFSSLRPGGAEIPEVMASHGVVRAGTRRPSVSNGSYTEEWARLVSVVFQGEKVLRRKVVSVMGSL